MPIYGLATIPLIRQLNGLGRQVWYADDSAATGTVSQLRAWWDKLAEHGPAFGYFPGIVVKQEHHVWLLKCFLVQGSMSPPRVGPI